MAGIDSWPLFEPGRAISVSGCGRSYSLSGLALSETKLGSHALARTVFADIELKMYRPSPRA